MLIVGVYAKVTRGGLVSCALDWMKKLEGLLEEFKVGFDDQRKRLSEVDLELSEILHELENVRFNVVEGYYYAKRIQELRVKRRLIKSEFEKYQRVNSQLIKNPNFMLERIKKGSHVSK